MFSKKVCVQKIAVPIAFAAAWYSSFDFAILRFAEVACTLVFGVVSITTGGSMAVLRFDELEFAKERFEMLVERISVLLRTFDSFFGGSSSSLPKKKDIFSSSGARKPS